ncbi:MAG: hypothetical protein KZQ70_15235 [gamma proteobacterium symbiont of Lucinoma myriamae]|nr:hypothetical protein [gamma proteobacterium symbiont of Lucinoma myriamae]
MKTLIKTVVLTSGLSISAAAMSQSLSLDEYYSDFMTADTNAATASEYNSDSVAVSDKLSLPEYYAEYCVDKASPSQAVYKSSNTQTEAANTCNNYYAEYLK